MDKKKNKTWFEGSGKVEGSLPKVQEALGDWGQFFVGMVSLMPGITEANLVEQGKDFVVIKTNEGMMKRSNISVERMPDKIKLEFDESYDAGKAISTNCHFLHEFSAEGDGLLQNLVISSLHAPGFLGFFYRNFGSKNIGNAFLNASKKYLET